MSVPVLARETLWCCPACSARDRTVDARPHSRFHTCAGLKGLTAPMVPEGVRCKIETHEREDYVGAEDVQFDGEGRPVMSVTTTRDDGQDCAVFVPCARGGIS